MALADENVQVVWQKRYAPFGGEEEQSGSFENSHQFTGKGWDEDAQLFYFNARWYDKDVGRFISEDPLWGSIWDPQSLNRFAYGRNNPYRYTDPTGKEGVEFKSGEDFYNEMLGEDADDDWGRSPNDNSFQNGGEGDNGDPEPSGNFLVVVTNLDLGALFFAGELGAFFVVDLKTGFVYEYSFKGVGIGIGLGVATSVQGGLVDINNLKSLDGLGLEVSGFLAAGRGVAGQIIGTSWFGDGSGGMSGGFAGGGGGGLSGLLTDTKYVGKSNLNNLPKHVSDIIDPYLPSR